MPQDELTRDDRRGVILSTARQPCSFEVIGGQDVEVAPKRFRDCRVSRRRIEDRRRAARLGDTECGKGRGNRDFELTENNLSRLDSRTTVLDIGAIESCVGAGDDDDLIFACPID